MRNIIAVVLAGGRGSRLMPLTNGRAKPAVPFAGKWTIFDFVMNSIINSEISKTVILTQYGAQALIDHVEGFGFSNPLYGQSVKCVPAQMRVGSEWYRGTADAVFQNLGLIMKHKGVDTAVILAGDHIYKIDIRQWFSFHRNKNAVFSVCTIPVSVEDAAGNFGVIEIDDDFRIVGFEEKPEHPKEIPGRPGLCLVSMGSYLASLSYLSRVLGEDASESSSSHDFGNDIIPKIVTSGAAIYAYDFLTNKVPGERDVYWRDVGTIGAYHDAHMDLVCPEPKLSLYNKDWPLRTFPDGLPPAKFVNPGRYERLITSGGCILDGASVTMSVLGREVRIHPGAEVNDTILFDGVVVGPGAKIHCAIIDEGVHVPEGVCIGCDREEDVARGLKVDCGVTIVPEGFSFD